MIEKPGIDPVGKGTMIHSTTGMCQTISRPSKEDDGPAPDAAQPGCLMFKRILYFLIPTTAIMWALFLTANVSLATPEDSKKEKKSCTFCQTTAGNKDLNGVGKCYAEQKHSPEGCEQK